MHTEDRLFSRSPKRQSLVSLASKSGAVQLSDWPVLSPEEVIRHTEAYMTLFGTACPDVMISHAIALTLLGRVDESLTFWQQVFTINPVSELGIAALAPQWKNSDLKPALDPLLDEFKLRGHVEAWIRAPKPPSPLPQPGGGVARPEG